MTHDQRLVAAAICFSLAMLALALLVPRAVGQTAVPAITPTIALGRTLVREAGLRASRRDDGPAIHAVISFRAEHIYRTDYLSAVLRATNRAPLRLDAPRPWIVDLWPHADRPALWPGHLRWENHNDRDWRRTYRHAIDIRRGEVEHSCRAGETPMVPHDWGNFYDAARTRREQPTAVELDCGQTCTLDHSGNVRLDRLGNPKCNYWFNFPRYEQRFGEP